MSGFSSASDPAEKAILEDIFLVSESAVADLFSMPLVTDFSSESKSMKIYFGRNEGGRIIISARILR